MGNDRGSPRSTAGTGGRFHIFRLVDRHLRRTMMNGLRSLLPTLVTVAVVSFILGYTDRWVHTLPWVAGKPWDVPGTGLFALLVLLYVSGLLLSSRPGTALMRGVAVVVSQIPVVRVIYGVTEQASEALASRYGFSRVVFIEWPREGMVAMGFVTGRAQSDASGNSIVMVYIPTVPNPTSGNLAFVIEDDVIETDLTIEHAMRLVFSGGIVLPPELVMMRLPREENAQEYAGRYRRV